MRIEARNATQPITVQSLIADIAAGGRKFRNLDMRGLNLSEMDLSGCEFRRCDIRGAVFANGKLVDTRFTECYARGVVLDDAWVYGCRFVRCDVGGGSFRNVSSYGSVIGLFSGCVGTEEVLEGNTRRFQGRFDVEKRRQELLAMLEEHESGESGRRYRAGMRARLESTGNVSAAPRTGENPSAEGSRPEVEGAGFEGPMFAPAIGCDVDLTGANLSGAYVGADWRSYEDPVAKLRRGWAESESPVAEIEDYGRIVLKEHDGDETRAFHAEGGVYLEERLAWVEAQLDSGRRDFQGYNFSDMDLAEMDLSGLDLSGAVFTGANVRGTSFRGSDLSYADFAGADAEEADFSRTRMERTVLSGAWAAGANMRGAFIAGAAVAGTTLSGADVRDAAVVDTDFAAGNESASLDSAHFGQALVRRCQVTAHQEASGGFADSVIQDSRIVEPQASEARENAEAGPGM